MYGQPSNNYIQQLIIAADIARSGSATAGTEVSPSVLANGEVVVTDFGGKILDTSTVLTANGIRIVQGRGTTNELKWSAPLTSSNINVLLPGTNAFSRAYAAEVQEVTYIGFNGTNGSIIAQNSTYYELQIRLRRQAFSQRHSVYMPITASYLSDATATEEEVTNGIYAAFVPVLNARVVPIIIAERVNSSAGAAITGAPTNWTFSKGSNIVTWTGTDPSNIVVGDYIRNGTGVTDPVYKVTAIDLANDNLTIDIAYQGATATVLNAAVEVILEATAQAADFGIKFTGLEQPFDVMTNPLSIVGFDMVLKNFGGTLITYATAPFIGQSTWKQISEIENDSWGNYGQTFTYSEYPGTPRFNDVVTGARYSSVYVDWVLPKGSAPLYAFKGSIQIACANDTVLGTFDTNITGASTSCIDVLDAFLQAQGLPTILPLP